METRLRELLQSVMDGHMHLWTGVGLYASPHFVARAYKKSSHQSIGRKTIASSKWTQEVNKM